MTDYSELKSYIDDRLSRLLDTPEIDGREVLALIAEVESLKTASQQLGRGLIYDVKTDGFYRSAADIEAVHRYSDELSKDAERYRWLREQHWNDSAMAVVFNPKVTVKLGAVCPSGLHLDQAIDEEWLKAKTND